MDDDEEPLNITGGQPSSSSASSFPSRGNPEQVPVPSRGVRGKQGTYVLPTSGTLWMWRRDEMGYHGLIVRSSAQNADICTASFGCVVVASSASRGRRTNTRLPVEDLKLLRDETSAPTFLLSVESSGILEDEAVPDKLSFSQLEVLLAMRCPWDSAQKHWVEMSNAKKTPQKKTDRGCGSGGHGGGGGGPMVQPAPQGVVRVDDGEAAGPDFSQIDLALNYISLALNQLPDAANAKDQLELVRGWLKVTRGKQSRKEGGVEYAPHYMLDSVLLADRLLRLDEMTNVVKEYLGHDSSRGGRVGIEVEVDS